MMNGLSRRGFVRTAGAGLCAAAFPRWGTAAHETSVSFFLVGDTHYLAEKAEPGTLNSESQATNGRLIDVLNQLPGSPIPELAGGGVVTLPQGVIHAGDLIDSGDKTGGVFAQMQETEWQGFVADYGLNGQGGRLKHPVFEVYGNHDSPHGDGLVIAKLQERNDKRTGLSGRSSNGLHYSWDWGNVHFVNVGLIVGEVDSVKRQRRYNPLQSLEFLIEDLHMHVGASGKPVVITHHIDVARYSTPALPEGPATSAEWDPADVHAYHEALKKYNVIAILYGHTHSRDLYRWNGTPQKGNEGISVYNVDNSAHFASRTQGLFYFEITPKTLLVRELVTTDKWQSWQWTPQVWSKPMSGAS